MEVYSFKFPVRGSVNLLTNLGRLFSTALSISYKEGCQFIKWFGQVIFQEGWQFIYCFEQVISYKEGCQFTYWTGYFIQGGVSVYLLVWTSYFPGGVAFYLLV